MRGAIHSAARSPRSNAQAIVNLPRSPGKYAVSPSPRTADRAPAAIRTAAAGPSREAAREARAKQRAALLSGDESALPARDKGPIKRGLGMAQGTWPRHVFADSSIEVRLLRDATIEARSSVQDIGTGARAAPTAPDHEPGGRP